MRRYTFQGTRQSFVHGHPMQSNGRTVNWTLVPDRYRIGTVPIVAAAAASASDTSIQITVPAGGYIPAQGLIEFALGGWGRITAAVDNRAGTTATTVTRTISAITAAVANGEKGWFAGTGCKFIPAGTTMAEQTDQVTYPGMIPYDVVRTSKTVSLAAGGGTAGAITGNGTVSYPTIRTTTAAKNGVYKVVFIEPTTNLGTFEVTDPNGVIIGVGVVGTLFDKEIKFTIADGSTDFASGDYFNATVTTQQGGAGSYTTSGLLWTDATESSMTDAVSGYATILGGCIVYENLLPEAVSGVLPTEYKDFLRLSGQVFTYNTYKDSRG